MNLNDIAKKALSTAIKRQANEAKIDHNTLPMLKHCAGEVIEATEAYAEYRNIKNLAEDLTATDLDEKWESQEEPDTCEEYYKECKSKFASELADVICCILIISANENIDIEEAVYKCMLKNAQRACGQKSKGIISESEDNI